LSRFEVKKFSILKALRRPEIADEIKNVPDIERFSDREVSISGGLHP
jgi:hypothetical protein